MEIKLVKQNKVPETELNRQVKVITGGHQNNKRCWKK